MCWIASLAGEDHETGITGTYRAQPEVAINIASRAMTELYSYAAYKRLDPLTASEIMRGKN